MKTRKFYILIIAVILAAIALSSIPAFAATSVGSIRIYNFEEPAVGNLVSFNYDILHDDQLMLMPVVGEYAAPGGSYQRMYSEETCYYTIGYSYRFTFSFELNDGYIFADSVSASVNEHTASVNKLNSKIAQVIYSFTLEPAKISSIEITGLKEPVIGNIVNYLYDVSANGEKEPEYLINLPLIWYKSADGKKFERLFSDEENRFEQNMYYRMEILFDREEGYEFDDNITVSVNGKNAQVTKDKTEGFISVVYDYDVLHVHSYVLKNASQQYLYKSATCTSKAQYYYSCSCGEKGTSTFEYGDTLPHDYGSEIASSDSSGHAFKCKNCGQAGAVQAHTPDRESADQTHAVICTECGYVIQNALEHIHSYILENASQQYLYKAATCTSKAQYYYSCSCGEKGTNTFEYGDTLPHDYGSEIASSDSSGHAFKCKNCGQASAVQAHTPDRESADQTHAVICTECGYVIQNALDHVHIPSSSYNYDGEKHYTSCEICGEQLPPEDHAYDDQGVCEICGYVNRTDNDGANSGNDDEDGGKTPGWVYATIIICATLLVGAAGMITVMFVLRKKK